MWLWIVMLFNVFASTFRAFNWGYQKESYIVSAFCYIPFIYDAATKAYTLQVILNTFYLITACLGIYRWHTITLDLNLSKTSKTSKKK